MQKMSVTKRIALSGVTVALAYALTFIEIPLFTDFFKLDFSFAAIMIAAFMLGPLCAEAIILCVECLCLIKSSSMGAGELCNFVLANVFIVCPSILYKYKKGIKWVIISLAIFSLSAVLLSLPLNRFVIFPVYKSLGFFPMTVKELFHDTFWYIIFFNLIKYFGNAIICVLLYKRVRWLVDKV